MTLIKCYVSFWNTETVIIKFTRSLAALTLTNTVVAVIADF